MYVHVRNPVPLLFLEMVTHGKTNNDITFLKLPLSPPPLHEAHVHQSSMLRNFLNATDQLRNSANVKYCFYYCIYSPVLDCTLQCIVSL